MDGGRRKYLRGNGKSQNRKGKKSRGFLIKLILLFSILCCAGILFYVVEKSQKAGEEKIQVSRSSEEGGGKNIPLSGEGKKEERGEEDKKEGGEDKSWQLTLVNKWHPMPEDYQVELTELSNGQSVDTRIYPALQKMFDAARSQGIYPIVASGYRTAEKQQSLMDEKVAEYKAEGCSTREAQRKARKWVAVPGTSEQKEKRV